MRPTEKKFSEYIPPLPKVLLLPPLALARVVSPDGMAVYASDDAMFKGAVFGRDSLEVADDIMDIKPALVHNILLTMGALQGLHDSRQNEEQPGKIIHEYRATVLDGKPIEGLSKEIFQKLANKWGGTDTELAYYGSIDSTPHFLRTLGRYCNTYGEDILEEMVHQRDSKEVSMRRVAQSATDWLLGELGKSRSGLLEFQMAHAQGTPNQTWKDSEESYVHENGEMANHDAPIASIEVQGLAYDALMAAGRFFPDQAAEFTERAENLRDITIDLLWQPDRNYFALGLDYDTEGTLRILATPTANPAALLDTDFFTDLPVAERQTYIAAIVDRITAADFLTGAGIRSRSLEMAHTVPFWDYHGSYVTWPKETYDIAKGLRRQGFPQLARQLENRLLNLVLKARTYPEFVYVDGDGKVLTGEPQKKRHGGVVVVEGYDRPESLQAWTVSAILAIMNSRGRAKLKRTKGNRQEAWQHELENTVLARIPHVDLHLNPLKLWLQYPTYRYHLAQSKDTRTV